MQKILVFLTVLMLSVSMSFGQGSPGDPPEETCNIPAHITYIREDYHDYANLQGSKIIGTDGAIFFPSFGVIVGNIPTCINLVGDPYYMLNNSALMCPIIVGDYYNAGDIFQTVQMQNEETNTRIEFLFYYDNDLADVYAQPIFDIDHLYVWKWSCGFRLTQIIGYEENDANGVLLNYPSGLEGHLIREGWSQFMDGTCVWTKIDLYGNAVKFPHVTDTYYTFPNLDSIFANTASTNANISIVPDANNDNYVSHEEVWDFIYGWFIDPEDCADPL